MRIVATSDTHYPVDVSTIPDGDVFIHAGDLMNTGYQQDWEIQLMWLNKLQNKFAKIYYICGNHDLHVEIYPGPSLQQLRNIGVTVLGFPGNSNFYTATLPNGMIIGGCPFVGGLQDRWAFGEATFAKYKTSPRAMVADLLQKCDILVTHSPFYGILDFSHRSNSNVGEAIFTDALNETILNNSIATKIIISGHIHEAYGHATYNTIKFYNVAMSDRIGQHVNSPLIIDL